MTCSTWHTVACVPRLIRLYEMGWDRMIFPDDATQRKQCHTPHHKPYIPPSTYYIPGVHTTAMQQPVLLPESGILGQNTTVIPRRWGWRIILSAALGVCVRLDVDYRILLYRTVPVRTLPLPLPLPFHFQIHLSRNSISLLLPSQFPYPSQTEEGRYHVPSAISGPTNPEAEGGRSRSKASKARYLQ